VLTNVDAGSLGKPLPQSLASVGTVFSGAGYATGYFGKWHLGGTPHGFSFATPERGKDPDILRAAAGWIREQKQPWLAWVSVINPHDIYSVRNMLNMKPRERVTLPASDLRNLAGKPAEQQEYVDRDQGKITRDFTPDQWRMYRSYYCDLVEKVDDCLGQVLAAVDLGSTVIAYTSDHGDALGEHGLPFKGPFMYEALVRIPFMIHDPRRLKARTRREELITQTDLAPTLAASAGIQWPGRVDGVDLLSGPVKRDAVFLEYYAKQKWVNPIRTIRTAEWKLNLYDSGNRELYHLASDPHEIRNLAGSKDAAVTERRLEERLNGWRGPMERNVRRD
jgi:arylsulfatase A-like enzyme